MGNVGAVVSIRHYGHLHSIGSAAAAGASTRCSAANLPPPEPKALDSHAAVAGSSVPAARSPAPPRCTRVTSNAMWRSVAKVAPTFLAIAVAGCASTKAAPNPTCGQTAVVWTTLSAAAGNPTGTRVVVQKTALTPSDQLILPDHFTVVVHTNDGQSYTKDAVITSGATGTWDSAAEYDFLFRNVDPSDIKEVLMTNSKGTCWVQGNPNN